MKWFESKFTASNNILSLKGILKRPISTLTSPDVKTFVLHNLRSINFRLLFSGRLSVIPVAVTLQERRPLETSAAGGSSPSPTRHKHVTSSGSLKEAARRKTRYVKEDLT